MVAKRLVTNNANAIKAIEMLLHHHKRMILSEIQVDITNNRRQLVTVNCIDL
jgi:hypothetical protein